MFKLLSNHENRMSPNFVALVDHLFTLHLFICSFSQQGFLSVYSVTGTVLASSKVDSFCLCYWKAFKSICDTVQLSHIWLQDVSTGRSVEGPGLEPYWLRSRWGGTEEWDKSQQQGNGSDDFRPRKPGARGELASSPPPWPKCVAYTTDSTGLQWLLNSWVPILVGEATIPSFDYRMM